MSSPDNRRFPRIPHVSSRQIIHVDSAQNPQRHLILTENLSASGIKFTTNSRLASAQYFLIYLNDQLMHEINSLYKDRARWVRSGDYYLTKVIWVKTLSPASDLFEIGATFVEKDVCDAHDLETFTELMNINMLERLPQRANVN